MAFSLACAYLPTHPPQSVTVDSSGNIYVANSEGSGYTCTPNAVQSTFGGGMAATPSAASLTTGLRDVGHPHRATRPARHAAAHKPLTQRHWNDIASARRYHRRAWPKQHDCAAAHHDAGAVRATAAHAGGVHRHAVDRSHWVRRPMASHLFLLSSHAPQHRSHPHANYGHSE